MPRKEILELIRKYIDPVRITKGNGFRLNDFDPSDTRGLQLEKAEAGELLQRGTEWLAEQQDMLYAQEPRALLNGAGAFGLKVQDRILALWKAQQRM